MLLLVHIIDYNCCYWKLQAINQYWCCWCNCPYLVFILTLLILSISLILTVLVPSLLMTCLTPEEMLTFLIFFHSIGHVAIENNLDPRLTLRGIAHDLYSTDPNPGSTGWTMPNTRGSYPETRTRSYRSGTYLPRKTYIIIYVDIDGSIMWILMLFHLPSDNCAALISVMQFHKHLSQSSIIPWILEKRIPIIIPSPKWKKGTYIRNPFPKQSQNFSFFFSEKKKQ